LFAGKTLRLPSGEHEKISFDARITVAAHPGNCAWRHRRRRKSARPANPELSPMSSRERIVHLVTEEADLRTESGAKAASVLVAHQRLQIGTRAVIHST
jgi:hypothetical protein